MWRFAPFYIALVAAPLLFGGVKPESQAALGVLMAVGLWWTRQFAGANVVPKWLKWAAIFWVGFSLLPLPIGLVRVIEPERARLAVEFPIDSATPHWLTLSVSPARAVQRVFELALAVGAFVLARRSARQPGASSRLALALGIALVFLGCSDIWSREHGRESILGLWKISWGKGAGTFANHNHFANWIYVAAVFCAGWILHEVFRRDQKPNRLAMAVVATATGFGLITAFASASRSGAIAFVAGALVFLALVRSQFQRRSFALAASVLIIAAVVVTLLGAEPLLNRVRTIPTASSLAGKFEIWNETARIVPRFPIFGAGAGSFVRVFNHYKSAHGDGTFWHAENDWLEVFFEYGIAGAILIFAIVLLCLRASFQSGPLLAGSMAALTVFAVHATGEFVSYMPANLILASALLGFAVGRNATQPAGRSSSVFPALLMAASLLQGFAWWNSWQAARAANPLPAIQRSLALWPFAVNRHIGQLRAAAKQNPIPAQAAALDSQINHALELDPMNWELRVEQTWFQLAYSTNTGNALSNAWLTVRLNPLQGQIPLRYARHFATRDPDLAVRFLAAVHPGVPANHEAALALAWDITHDPAQLWTLTPNTIPTLRNLIHFAQSRGLFPIAAQVCQALEGRIDTETLAQLYFDAQRPDQTLRLLEDDGTSRAQILRIRSLAQLGRFTEALAAAQQFLAPLKNIVDPIFQPTTSYGVLVTNQQQHPSDPAAALLVAEKSAMLPPADLQLLSNLVAVFPGEPRIGYILLQAQLAAGQTNAAAQSAAALVSRLP